MACKQVPEEAWAAQSLQASAEHLLNAMDGHNSSLRGSALQMLLDNLAYRPALPAAFSHALAQSAPVPMYLNFSLDKVICAQFQA